ncbi:MAG TPA: hypothetical protein VJV78_12675 [Polyangiales bacterium]|nr:hypothetical protein [Polyangiales bacterium]
MTCRSAFLALALVACQVVSTPADAQDAPAKYEDLIDDAVHEFQLGNFIEARTLFEHAHKERPNARTLRGLGFCAFELHHYGQAVRELEAALRDDRLPLTADQQADVRATLDKAQRYVGSLIIELEPAGANLTVDGQATISGEMLVDIGEHVIAASAAGHLPREQRVTVTGGQRVRVRVKLSPDPLSPQNVAASQPASTQPAAAPSASRSKSVFEQWWFWTLAGVAVSGIAVGTIIAVSDQPASPSEGNSGSTGVILHPPGAK